MGLSAISYGMLNAPFGVPQLDGDGNLPANVRVMTGTAGEINPLVLAAGQMAWVDWAELRVGDNITAGGIPVGRVSSATVFLEARPGFTDLQNGVALKNAYTVAGALLPNGVAPSATNWAGLDIGAGSFNITGGATASWNLNTAFLALTGRGAEQTRIITDGTHDARVSAATNHIWKRLRFVGGAVLISAAQPAFLHEDLYFESSTPVTGQTIQCSASAGVWGGTVRRCYSNARMYTGPATTTTNTIVFEDCAIDGTRGFFGGASGGTNNNFHGVLRRCRAPALLDFFLSFHGTMENCVWGYPLLLCKAGARIRNSLIVPPSNLKCINANAATEAIQVWNCGLKSFGAVDPMGANVSNQITTPNNIISDNLTI